MSAINMNNFSAPQQPSVQPQKTSESKERYKIQVPVTSAFPSLFEVMYTDTEEFPTFINGLLRPMFVDFYGSKVEIVQNKQLYSTIFFTEKFGYDNKDHQDGPYAAIERIVKKDNNRSADARIQSINHMSNFGRTKLFKLTTEAQESLQDIIPTNFINRDNGKVDWNKIVYESSGMLTNGSTQATPYVQVVVDINRILQKIYGGLNDGNEWQYMVNVNNPIAPVATPHGTISNKWQLFITRVSTSWAREIASQFGFVIGSNNMGIITK
jgi:hypothetical protein